MQTIEQRMQDIHFVNSMQNERILAKELGDTRYYTGIPCHRGHDSWRKTSNGVCAKCASLLTNNKIKATNPIIIGEYRTKSNKNWNSSMKGKSAKQRWRMRDPKWAWVVSAVGGARSRSTKSRLLFTITNEYIHSITPDKCPVFGTAFTFIGASNKHLSANVATLDRIVPELGYVVGNVCVISMKANAIKSNASTEDVEKVLKWMKSVL